jgi:CHAD domain-containing protein
VIENRAARTVSLNQLASVRMRDPETGAPAWPNSRFSSMPANGSSPHHLNEAQAQTRLVFDRMGRCIARFSKSLAPENVHRFRTNSRRVEALVGQLAPETRNKKKLLKLLSKLRKRAGRLRDLDVQLAFLKELKVPDRLDHRAQLLELLAEEHRRRSRKLSKAADAATLEELRKRLRREQGEIKLDGINPLGLAARSLPQLGPAPLTEKTLHAFRIAAKRARYLAELGGEAPQAKVFVAELKRAQDAIGEWHDILKLKDKAEKRFGSASDSALVSVLQNLSRARFRAAGNALAMSLETLSPRPAAAQRERPEAKGAESHTAARSAAVA